MKHGSRTVVGALALAAFAIVSGVTAAAATDAGSTSVSAGAEATLQRDGKDLFLLTRSHSFELAQFAAKAETKTVLVEGEVAHRLRVTDDLGAKGDETGTVKLSIRPVDPSGQFGVPVATREMPGDEIKLESPSGVTVITYGCCQENTAEQMLSLASLKTLYVRSGGAPITTYTRLGKPALGRLIVVYLAMTAADDAVLGSDRSVIGMITLTGEDEVMQRIRVHLRAAQPREAALQWSVELGWKTASGKLENHTVIDPGKSSHPVFRWKLNAAQTIDIPLENDRLDLAAAKLPPTVKLEVLGVDDAAKSPTR